MCVFLISYCLLCAGQYTHPYTCKESDHGWQQGWRVHKYSKHSNMLNILIGDGNRPVKSPSSAPLCWGFPLKPSRRGGPEQPHLTLHPLPEISEAHLFHQNKRMPSRLHVTCVCSTGTGTVMYRATVAYCRI